MSQDRINLEQVKLDSITSEEILSEENQIFGKGTDDLWGYPSYLTYDMTKFSWDDIFLEDTDVTSSKAGFIQRNRLELMMDSTNSKLIALKVSLYKQEAQAKQILQSIKQRYGEPVILAEHDSKEFLYSAYWWPNVSVGQSLIWSIAYSEDQLNEQIISSMDLYLIKDETTYVRQDSDYNDINVLEYFVQMYSRWSVMEIREKYK